MTENEEQLVADFAADFAERFRDGEEITLDAYLEKLPTEEMKQEFMLVANMSRFMTVMSDMRDAEAADVQSDHADCGAVDAEAGNFDLRARVHL